MTITERVNLKKNGIEVLRPMYDPRKLMWKIVKCTTSGGWTRYGGSWYFTKELAQDAINDTVRFYPDHYKSDN